MATSVREISPREEDLPAARFRLAPEELPVSDRDRLVTELAREMGDRASTMLGFQVNETPKDFRGPDALLRYHANNAGDPFVPGDFTLNTKHVERAVLDHFAELWHADSYYWGYVLNMGSTEGNLHALWSARDLLESASVGSREPVLFRSANSHYSLPKVAGLLRLRTFHEVGAELYEGQCPLATGGTAGSGGWPAGVPVDGHGEVDVDSLVRLVEFFAARGHPAVVNFNYGATSNGAFDDVERACRALRPVLVEHGMYGDGDSDRGYWVHVDGAFGAAYMPYLETGFERGMTRRRGPVFDFRVPEVCSIVCSGHKYIGMPWPCGVYLTRSDFFGNSGKTITGSPDNTLGGSRNALSPVFLWYEIAGTSTRQRTLSVLSCLRTAEYAEHRLRELDGELRERGRGGLDVERAPLSLSVRFRKPDAEVMAKYVLPEFALPGEQRPDHTHLYVLPHVDERLVDALVSDLRASTLSGGSSRTT
ncbi:hypothetical protein CDG81_15220 [Actinopolyspora erythraea]|uniref:Histidine decarboxylase n=1 Tax=Actinopolyspora erythraea TaxID=414996 RepID=A0A223RU54_9ACTN|nr:pyridoxal-dependent decarboxylase [Actinopolyspora erythraea]ASU79413.1 hypothetical protein CDG81_15220 [Actinopolyspora erythraea]